MTCWNHDRSAILGGSIGVWKRSERAKEREISKRLFIFDKSEVKRQCSFTSENHEYEIKSKIRKVCVQTIDMWIEETDTSLKGKVQCDAAKGKDHDRFIRLFGFLFPGMSKISGMRPLFLGICWYGQPRHEPQATRHETRHMWRKEEGRRVKNRDWRVKNRTAIFVIYRTLKIERKKLLEWITDRGLPPNLWKGAAEWDEMSLSDEWAKIKNSFRTLFVFLRIKFIVIWVTPIWIGAGFESESANSTTYIRSIASDSIRNLRYLYSWEYRELYCTPLFFLADTK